MSRRIFPNPAQQHLLKTVRLELIEPGEFARWNELIERHHYLHNAVLVGEVLSYAPRAMRRAVGSRCLATAARVCICACATNGWAGARSNANAAYA